MNKANVKYKGWEKSKETDIDAFASGQLQEDKVEEITCTGCGNKAHIYHFDKDGSMSFRCKKHKKGCPTQAKEEQHDEKLIVKKKKIYKDITLNNDLILYGNDRAPSKPKEPTPGPDEGDNADIDVNTANGIETPQTSEQPNDCIEGSDMPSNEQFTETTPDKLFEYETAHYYEFGIKNIASTKSLIYEIKAKGLQFNMGDGRVAADLLLNDIQLHTVRKTGFSGLKIAITTRLTKTDIKFLKEHNLYPEGKDDEWTIVKDAYSEDPENTIYFKIKCKNNEQNKYLKYLISGKVDDPRIRRDARKYLIVYTFWEREVNDFVSIYKAEITYRQYAFFDDIKIGE